MRVGGAGNILRSDGDDRAGFQQDGLVALQQAGADLGALQILQDADGAAFALGGAAQALDVVGVIFVRAVGKIEAGDVHAEAQQVAHGGFGVAGRADGADDFGAAGATGLRRLCELRAGARAGCSGTRIPLTRLSILSSTRDDTIVVETQLATAASAHHG